MKNAGRLIRHARCAAVVAIALTGCRDHGARSSAESAGVVDTGRGATTAVVRPPATVGSTKAVPSRPAPIAKAPAPSAQTPAIRAESASVRAESTVSVARTTAPAAPPPAPLPAPSPAPSPLALALAKLPFQNNERLEYQVKYGFLGVGSAVLEVLGVDSVRGAAAIHATFSVKGGVRIYRVNDNYESWFDPTTFSTLRAKQNIDEGSYDRQRNFEFFPDRKTFTENEKPEAPTVPDPLDEASFLFYLRSIPLEVGQTYEFPRYFRPDKNPVRVVVVRKEPVNVPAGHFDAIVVRPVIKTSGIFGEGGRAEMWFTDDSTRTLVQLKSSLKFGSLNLYLRSRRPGVPWQGAATVATPVR
jgi:hypothetical protein